MSSASKLCPVAPCNECKRVSRARPQAVPGRSPLRSPCIFRRRPDRAAKWLLRWRAAVLNQSALTPDEHEYHSPHWSDRSNHHSCTRVQLRELAPVPTLKSRCVWSPVPLDNSELPKVPCERSESSTRTKSVQRRDLLFFGSPPGAVLRWSGRWPRSAFPPR